MKIRKLTRHEDGHWTWYVGDDDSRIYYTNKDGQGIFVIRDCENASRQLTGTCQFSACETVSGMRRKLHRFFDDELEG